MTIIVSSRYMNAGHYRPASETPFWRFTGGPIAAQDFVCWVLTCVCAFCLLSYSFYLHFFFIYFYPRSFPAFCEKLLSSDFAAIISYFCMKPYFFAKIKSGYLNIL